MITCTFEKGYSDHLRHMVVHALLVQDDAIFLAKRSGDIPESGKWNIPGGFMQRDETAGEGALRELYEETGWKGKIISLFRFNSDPHRANEDRQNVIAEYLVAPIEQSGTPDHESSRMEWVPFDRLLPEDAYAFDHGQSLYLVKKYFQTPFPLPIII
jgi:ADP-ribose pyrophosphatase YjhB (NUDIX family)